MEVDSTDKRGNWIKCRLLRGRCGSKERTRDMTGNKNALNAQLNPVSGEVRRIDPLFFFALVGMRLEDKPVDAIPLPEKSLMILPIMLVCDLGVQPKERGEKRVLRVGGINVNWRFRYDGRHILKRDGSGGPVIKENSVRRRRSGGVGGGRSVGNWNVHDSTGQKHM